MPLTLKSNHPLFFESQAWQKGYSQIAGVDEAGRGPLAGPVVAAACILEEGAFFEGVTDSKKITPKKRQELYCELTSSSKVVYSVGVVDAKRIDEINIYQATIVAMQQAVDGLEVKPCFLLVDGLRLPHMIPNLKIVRGDQLSHSIGAASILAKVERDRQMYEFDRLYPQYGFAKHKGYGTRSHLEAIEKHGPCEIHRRSFEPVKSLFK